MDAADLTGAFQRLRDAQRLDPRAGAATRIDRLKRATTLLRENADAICAALVRDFGWRPDLVTRLVEIGGAITALDHARQNVRRWMKPRRVRLEWSMRLTGARARIDACPKGVVGIVAPWNFPVQLTFAPLAAALAAGNRAMVKLPEGTPALSTLLADLFGRAFAEDEVVAVTGDADTGSAFCALPFDHLLFTGSPAIGRSVMAAASANLTPVTLELGGRSPVVVLPDADLAVTARSLLAGKILNAGQICLAPDHVHVPTDRLDALMAALRAEAALMVPAGGASSVLNAIVSDRHAQRQRDLIADATACGALIEPLVGGAAGDRVIGPTLIVAPPPQARVLHEEVFGPLLPLLPYDDLDSVIARINAGAHPLALYIFGHDRAAVRRLLAWTTSGGVTVNDILLHASSERLPLGGIGESGMGAYRGRWGFDTFSHQRPVFHRGLLDLGRVMRPPFGRLARMAARQLTGG